MFKTVALGALASAIFISANILPAAAESCSDRIPECIAAKGATPAGCHKEAAACRARCKAGNKIWVGTVSGKHYPVTSCN